MLAVAVADMNVKFFSRNNSASCVLDMLLQRTIEYPGVVATAAAAACLCTRRLC